MWQSIIYVFHIIYLYLIFNVRVLCGNKRSIFLNLTDTLSTRKYTFYERNTYILSCFPQSFNVLEKLTQLEKKITLDKRFLREFNKFYDRSQVSMFFIIYTN